MKTPFFATVIPSSLEGMAATIRSAIEAMKRHGWVEADNEFCAHLCLEEALVNAIQHGNKGDAGLRVRLEICEDDERCRIFVYDEGEGFCPTAVPEPKVEQARGRGLCLIRHFMDHVHFHGKEHCLEMAFRRKAFSKGGCGER